MYATEKTNDGLFLGRPSPEWLGTPGQVCWLHRRWWTRAWGRAGVTPVSAPRPVSELTGAGGAPRPRLPSAERSRQAAPLRNSRRDWATEGEMSHSTSRQRGAPRPDLRPPQGLQPRESPLPRLHLSPAPSFLHTRRRQPRGRPCPPPSGAWAQRRGSISLRGQKRAGWVGEGGE